MPCHEDGIGSLVFAKMFGKKRQPIPVAISDVCWVKVMNEVFFALYEIQHLEGTEYRTFRKPSRTVTTLRNHRFCGVFYREGFQQTRRKFLLSRRGASDKPENNRQSSGNSSDGLTSGRL